MILVTGGAGFVGLNYILGLLQYTDATEIVNLDLLAHATNRAHLPNSSRHVFVHGSISDRVMLNFLLKRRPKIIVNFAAETDSATKNNDKFLLTNVNGTYNLLEGIREHCPESLFVQVSTDKVYGSLGEDQLPFAEHHKHNPVSPYYSTKSSADSLVQAWHQTYGLRTIITHCSNNYGPLQIGNKLIPATISQAINEKPIPIHGSGFQTRDWIHVEDHCSALRYILSHGETGQSYNIGANNEQTNIGVVHNICTVLDEIKPRANGRVYSELIEFGEDKLNNLNRCAVNTDKLNQLGWYKKRNFNESIKTLIVHALKSA